MGQRWTALDLRQKTLTFHHFNREVKKAVRHKLSRPKLESYLFNLWLLPHDFVLGQRVIVSKY